jgi:hypothetical protein
MSKVHKKEGLVVPRGDGFDVSFAEYHTSEKLADFRLVLNDRHYNVGETDVAYRVVNHWDQSDLMPDGVVAGGWRKFNYVEMTWLRIVQHLRDFGMPLKTILKAKQGVIEWHKDTDSYPYFEYYVAAGLISDLDTYVAVTKDGRAGLVSTDEIPLLRLTNEGALDLVLISIKGIIKAFGVKNIPDPKLTLTLGKKEAEIFSILAGENKEVKVGMKNKAINDVETVQILGVKDSLNEIDKKFKLGKLFGEVTIKYENGVQQSREVRARRRFK